MTDRKRSINSFFDGSAPLAKKVVTADFEFNKVRANDLSEQEKKLKCTEKLMSLENIIRSLKKDNTEGDWQKFHLSKISWTYVIQTWTHKLTKKSIDLSHFSPYGMNLYIQKMQSLPSCKSSYQTVSQVTKLCLKRSVKSFQMKSRKKTTRLAIFLLQLG